MLNTHLFLTQTYLNLHNIQLLLVHSFLVHNNLSLRNSKAILSNNDILVETFEHYRNCGQVIIWSADKAETESQKDAFRRYIQSEVYVQYNKSTMLFLGDLTDYSDSLQEGMLKLLEEPPTNLSIVIFAQNMSMLKPTIISRCQIHLIPTTLVFQNLDLTLLEKTKKLPAPKDIVQSLISGIKIDIDKVKEMERNELDFWLWQLQTNLSAVFAQNPEVRIANAITKVLMARKLNSDNLQKKFAIGWLNT